MISSLLTGARLWGLVGISALLAVGVTAAPAAAEPDSARPRTIVDLGALPGGTSWAADINDDGIVVGGSSDPVTASQHAIRWDRTGRMTDLGSVDGLDTYAQGINRHGTVFGAADHCSSDREDSCALRWSPTGELTRLPGLTAGDGTLASAMNDFDVVVGSSRNIMGSYEHPVLWDRNGRVVGLKLPPGAAYGWAAGINNLGIVVGTAMFPDRPMRALLWDRTGRMTQLPQPPGAGSWATGITDDGLIIGNISTDDYHLARWRYRGGNVSPPEVVGVTSYTAGMSRNGIALSGEGVRWDRNGRITQLEPLSGDLAVSTGRVNDAGIAIGASGTTNGDWHAAWWDRSGTPRELPTPSLGAQISASAINNGGVIVGRTEFATGTHAAVWR
jgi:probable HAF family extracellular repeat protein